MLRNVAMAVVVGLAACGQANAEVKILPTITGAGVIPGYTIKPVGYPYPVHHHGHPVAYPTYPVYPGYPVAYPSPVHVAPTYTVWVRTSYYGSWHLHGAYASHATAHGIASGLKMHGYITYVGH